MRILLLSHKFFPDIGGIETISEILAMEFSKEGHKVHIVTWTETNNEDNYPFTVVRKPSIKKMFQEHNWAEVVFENNPCLRLSWPSFFYKKRHLIGIQTWITRTNGKISVIDKFKLLWLKRAKRVIACSEAIRKRCWPTALVIENPFKESLFKTLDNVTRNKEFVFVGRLVSDKGADLAIKAFRELQAKQEFNDYKMTIIGEGPEKEALNNFVHALQLQEYVKFTGALRGQELVQCLNQHKFILVPSLWEEPFGIVALEGMACGCLPIVSDGGGLPNAIGKAGLTFRRGDLSDLVRCIESLLHNPEKEKQLKLETEKHLLEHTSKEVGRKYLEIIANCTAANNDLIKL